VRNHNPKEEFMEQSAQTARKPTHRVYQVTGEGKQAFWREIGAAWPHKDRRGFSITYHALPLTGRIVVRRIKPKAEGSAQ
jgi:hypothetical protein